ncbi:hypothetical protein WBJ53_22055 [Spirosoma sp. SC4-14]|uniref:hypothetical protein n=1 Tax=Spirosoma sp. SC4-14 TaxID=3128900 RepID=UPI0030D0FFA2
MDAPKRSVNIELLLGISATFLSLAALVVSIFQTRIDREQQYASVWPYIQTMGANFDQELHFGFENKGVGPAIIKSFELIYRGRTYKRPKPLFLEYIGKNTRGGKGFTDVTPGDVFKSGENTDVLFVSKNDTVISQVASMLADSSFHLRIRYADVYGNCWELDQNKVTAIGKCN